MNIPFQMNDGGDGNERMACTVRAIAIAGELPYSEAHNLLKQAGRKDNHRFKFSRWMISQSQIGLYRVNEIRCVPAKTINQLSALKLQGRYLVRVRGHVFALIDGVIHDRFLWPIRSRIQNIWKLEAR